MRPPSTIVVIFFGTRVNIGITKFQSTDVFYFKCFGSLPKFASECKPIHLKDMSSRLCACAQQEVPRYSIYTRQIWYVLNLIFNRDPFTEVLDKKGLNILA